MTVSDVDPQGYGFSLGVRDGWKIKSIGDIPILEKHGYRDVTRLRQNGAEFLAE